jgi:hypothetical protein
VARAIILYPPDHGLALARVMRVIDVIVGRPDIRDDEVVALLVGEGVGRVDAELLIRFVPSALSYPVLKRLGVTSGFSFYIVRSVKGRVVHMPLANEHYFMAALAWAEGVFAQEPATRQINLDQFHAVAGRSGEMECANKLLGSHGPDGLRGATVGPAVLFGITADEIAASRRGDNRGRPWWRFWG